MSVSLMGQQWKRLVRSKYFKQGWGVKILMGFLIFYFTVMFTALGVFLPELLEETYPKAEKLTPVFSGFILYYILIELALRFFLQDLSVLSIQHYLTIPIKKTKIIHYLLRGSIFNFFNFLPLLFIIPWAIRVVGEEYGSTVQWTWLLAMMAIVLFNHFLAIYIKRVLAVNQKVFLIFAGVLALLLLGDFMEWISLQDISTVMFIPLVNSPVTTLAPLAAFGALYLVNFRFLLAHTYLDVWQEKASNDARVNRFSFLESRGIIGSMVANELKLITRNKRTKSVLFVTLLFSAYGLIFYTQPEYNNGYGWLLFVGIFMTGIFMINYGQFLVAWESSFFDGILTRKYSIEDFYKAKFMLLAVSCVITYILSMPYMYFGIKALYINTASFLYNVGLNSFILLYASTYNKKRIDLSKGSAFNYQGTGATQFVIVIPLLVFPLLIFKAFDLFGKPNYGLITLSIMGLISLAFARYWFREIVKNFKEKKYINAQGFRDKT